ncbi:hypothetical protein KAI87_17610, partial [Myxococcota bacterium]|nr:hypothetical protein [Myxococcota bacterium]
MSDINVKSPAQQNHVAVSAKESVKNSAKSMAKSPSSNAALAVLSSKKDFYSESDSAAPSSKSAKPKQNNHTPLNGLSPKSSGTGVHTVPKDLVKRQKSSFEVAVSQSNTLYDRFAIKSADVRSFSAKVDNNPDKALKSMIGAAVFQIGANSVEFQKNIFRDSSATGPVDAQEMEVIQERVRQHQVNLTDIQKTEDAVGGDLSRIDSVIESIQSKISPFKSSHSNFEIMTSETDQMVNPYVADVAIWAKANRALLSDPEELKLFDAKVEKLLAKAEHHQGATLSFDIKEDYQETKESVEKVEDKILRSSYAKKFVSAYNKHAIATGRSTISLTEGRVSMDATSVAVETQDV